MNKETETHTTNDNITQEEPKPQPQPLLFGIRNTKIQNGSMELPLKRIMMQPAGHHDGCTAWRIDWVREFLNYNKLAVADMSTIPPVVGVPRGESKVAVNPIFTSIDAMLVQRPVMDQHPAMFSQYITARDRIRKSNNRDFRIIIDIDDVLHYDHIAKFNVGRKGYINNTRFNIFKEVVNMSDELHVCSPTMKNFYEDHLGYKNITYRPNLMPRHMFDTYDRARAVRNYVKHRKKPRILWAGSWSHFDISSIHTSDDFTRIRDVIMKTVDDFQWIFYGAHPVWAKDLISEGKIEYINWGSIANFPRNVKDIEANIIIAPLDDNVFNRCKSNIKLTESGAFGIAGVFQDMEPYHEAPHKFNTGDELIDQIKYILTDTDTYIKVVEQMRGISEKFFIEENKNLLYASLFCDYGSVEREIISPRLYDLNKINLLK